MLAQAGYTVSHFTDDNGLPQNSVKGLAPDNDGYIWLATENGLARFDGHRFYNIEKSALGITSNRFYLLMPSLQADGTDAKDQRNTLVYAATDAGEYARIGNGTAFYDSAYTNGRMKRLPFMRNGASNTFLASGLPTFMSNIAKPEHYVIPVGYGNSNAYVIDSTSVSFYNDQQRLYKVPFADQSFWTFFTMGRLLYHMDDDGFIAKVTGNGVSKVGISGDLIRDNGYDTQLTGLTLYWNIASDQVCFYFRKKLYSVDNERNGRLATKLILQDFDLEELNIQTVHRDATNGTIFMGSISDGFYVLTKHSFETLRHQGKDMDNVFYAQLDYGKNAVMTPTGVILEKDPVTGKTFSGKLPFLEKINPNDKRTLLRDKAGYIWVKAGDKLYQLDIANEKVIHVWSFSEEVKHIFQDSRGNIWIGLAEKGVYLIDLSQPDFKPRHIQDDIRVTYFEQDRAGKVLAGTINGLYTFDADGHKNGLVPGTEDLYIKSMFVDRGDRLWMVVNQEGLVLYEHKKLISFPLDKNRYLGSPHCIVDDTKGFFWIPTDKGLFQVAIEDLLNYAKSPVSELFYMYHAKGDGLLTNEFNGGCQPCSARIDNGYISLPSLNGLVWFKPEQITANVPAGRIVLDRIQVNNSFLATTGDTLTLPGEPVQTKFYFSTPYYGNSNNLSLSYALLKEGHAVTPADWIPILGPDFSITFANLDPGAHKLIVRKMNGFGKNNYTIRTILVIVPPLWYQTWWVRVLFLIGAVLIIYLYNTLRLRNISNENARLEEIVAKRTERLNRALSDIEESKTEMSRQIHMLSRLLASITHDIQSPLNYIMLTSGAIPAMVQRGELNEVTEIGQVISNSSQRMSDLLRGLLDYIKLHVYGNSVQFEDVNLRILVENKYQIFQNVIELNGNQFLNEIPDHLTVSSDYQMLAIMIHNLIDNATKFTCKGVIRVFSEMNEQGQVRLMIANTGEGISDELMEVINAAVTEEADDVMRPFGRKTGLGLLIVKEIAELIHVKLSLTRSPETCFVMTFPSM
ncbi:MAG: two-component regulator propeller domain-containing protein [Dyadobacter sp.]|uniref:sensor histidine kinase n=1 Tax=Dyadobacter sp. TaxID=1914288 RepID=UPI0032663379